MERFGHDMRVDKKGAIDLVTEVDLAVERDVRALIAERFPIIRCLPRRWAAGRRYRRGLLGLRLIDGTTTTRMACRFSAPRWRSRSTVAVVGAVYDRPKNCSRPSATAARSQRASARVSGRHPARLHAGHRIPYDVHDRVEEIVGLFAAFIGQARAVRRLGSAAIDLCYVAAGRMDGFWERDLKPWDVAAGALIVAEAGGRVTQMDGQPFQSRHRHVLASNGRIHDAMLVVIEQRASF